LLVAQASDGTIAIAPSIAQQNVEAFAISGDGAWLAAGYGNEMSVISMRELREVARCRGHTEKIQTVRFDSDSTQLVTASSDGTARTWNCIDGKPVAVMVGHREWIADAAFNSDGSRVVTASTDGTARLWDARNGAELLGFDHEDYMTSARFTADDQAILAVSQWGRIHVWNSRPRRAREAERQDRERALAAARAWVEQLLEDEHDLAAVVRRLRDDSSHSDLERELAPVDLMTRLVSGYAQADELISRYALRHGRREHLARDLEREPGLHWIVRALAQNYINEWVDRPDPPEDNR
jgi:WD40 repeat protein